MERIESGVGTGTELRIGREFRKHFPSADYVAKPGEKSSLVYVIQVMLGDISHTYDGLENVEVTGVYDEATCDGVKLFQHYHRMEETGNVDRKTWDALAASYNVFANNNNYIS